MLSFVPAPFWSGAHPGFLMGFLGKAMAVLLEYTGVVWATVDCPIRVN